MLKVTVTLDGDALMGIVAVSVTVLAAEGIRTMSASLVVSSRVDKSAAELRAEPLDGTLCPVIVVSPIDDILVDKTFEILSTKSSLGWLSEMVSLVMSELVLISSHRA